MPIFFMSTHKKGSYTSYLHFIEKAQQNLSKCSCTTAIFVCGHEKNGHVQPFKLLRSALIKLPSKQKHFIHLLSTFHKNAQQNPSKHACTTAVFVCACKKNLIRALLNSLNG